MADEPKETPPKVGKTSSPYKDGNTREDGSYAIGKGRPPPEGQFAKNDGRERGRRAKGTRNLSTDWREELAEQVEISEGGKKKKVTKQRGVVKATTARAMKGSDRAAEIVFRYGSAGEAQATKLRLSDREIIEQWLGQQSPVPKLPKVSDDLDQQRELPSNLADDGTGADASQ